MIQKIIKMIKIMITNKMKIKILVKIKTYDRQLQ